MIPSFAVIQWLSLDREMEIRKEAFQERRSPEVKTPRVRLPLVSFRRKQAAPLETCVEDASRAA
jgi:hypothetical protein